MEEEGKEDKREDKKQKQKQQEEKKQQVRHSGHGRLSKARLVPATMRCGAREAVVVALTNA